MGGRGSMGSGSGQITKINSEQSFNKVQRDNKSVQGLSKQELKKGYEEADGKTSGGTQAHLDFLVNSAQKLGYKVKFADAPASKTANGQVHYPSRTIYVKPSRSKSQQVKTLAHELAHSQLHSKNPRFAKMKASQKQKIQEMESETFASMVTNKFGMKNEVSKHYVEMWRVHNPRSPVSKSFLSKSSKPHLTKLFNQIFEE